MLQVKCYRLQIRGYTSHVTGYMLEVTRKRYLLRNRAPSVCGVVVSLSGSLRTEGREVSQRKLKQWVENRGRDSRRGGGGGGSSPSCWPPPQDGPTWSLLQGTSAWPTDGK